MGFLWNTSYWISSIPIGSPILTGSAILTGSYQGYQFGTTNTRAHYARVKSYYTSFGVTMQFKCWEFPYPFPYVDYYNFIPGTFPPKNKVSFLLNVSLLS